MTLRRAASSNQMTGWKKDTRMSKSLDNLNGRKPGGRYSKTMQYALNKTTQESKMYGVPLAEAVEKNGICGIPMPLYQCIGFLEMFCLSEEGLYRVPGSKQTVDLYKALYNSGHTPQFEKREDPGTVTSLLVAFFRELPDTAFTPEGYSRVVSMRGKPETESVAEIKNLYQSLPETNRNTVAALVWHLRHVADNESTTKMTASSLAMCMFPMIVGPMSVMIKNCADIFPKFEVDPKVLEEIETLSISTLEAQQETPLAPTKPSKKKKTKKPNSSDNLDAPVPNGGDGRGRKSVKAVKGFFSRMFGGGGGK